MNVLRIILNYKSLIKLFQAIGLLLAEEDSSYFGQGDTNYRYYQNYNKILELIKDSFEPFRNREYWQYKNDAEKERWKAWKKNIEKCFEETEQC